MKNTLFQGNFIDFLHFSKVISPRFLHFSKKTAMFTFHIHAVETDGKGMEIESVGSVSVEVIAQYRHPETLLAGTMEAQLVCPACQRVKAEDCMTLIFSYDFIVGNSLLAFFIIHYLTWTIDIICA